MGLRGPLYLSPSRSGDRGEGVEWARDMPKHKKVEQVDAAVDIRVGRSWKDIHTGYSRTFSIF
jgi:hypothetical protein